jgi:hypothetical protein
MSPCHLASDPEKPQMLFSKSASHVTCHPMVFRRVDRCQSLLCLSHALPRRDDAEGGNHSLPAENHRVARAPPSRQMTSLRCSAMALTNHKKSIVISLSPAQNALPVLPVMMEILARRITFSGVLWIPSPRRPLPDLPPTPTYR